MPQIDQLSQIFGSQLFWLVIAFGLIFFVIGRGMLPKIRSATELRDKAIADDLEKARAARVIANSIEVEWRERMDAARLEAARTAEEARQASARQSEARLKEAVLRIDEKTELASQRIRDAVTAARAELETVAAEAAQEIVLRITGMPVDKRQAAEAVVRELKILETAQGPRIRSAAARQSAREAAE